MKIKPNKGLKLWMGFLMLCHPCHKYKSSSPHGSDLLAVYGHILKEVPGGL